MKSVIIFDYNQEESIHNWQVIFGRISISQTQF